MKITLTHMVNREKTVFDKTKKIEKCYMTSVKFEKTLEYFKIQESLRPENLKKYYLCKGIFLYDFLYHEIYKHEVKQITELAGTLWLFA